MLTDFGRELQKLRKARGERILDMACKMKVSPAFISNIEHGRKEPPSGFDIRLIKAYELRESDMQQLLESFARARSDFTIAAQSNLQKETVAMFARKLPTVSQERLLELQCLLNRSVKVEAKK